MKSNVSICLSKVFAYEVPKVVKLTETECRKEGKLVFMGIEFEFCKTKL